MMRRVVDRYRLILYYLGIFMLLTGCIILLPCVILIFYPSESRYAYSFIIPGVSSILLGYLIYYFMRGSEIGGLEHIEDSLLVVSIWVMAILISTVPFMLNGYSFVHALFEVTSGYSTTGLSVVDVDSAPRIFLFYRSILLFVGGVGFVLILTSAISDRYSLRLYNLEGHTDKLLPNLVSSARVIFLIYALYITLGSVAYVICGMSVFDAVNHSIAAVSTGGFSSRGLGIYGFDSVAIEVVTMCLMMLGGTNFLIHLMLIRGKVIGYFKHCETFLLGILILVFVPVMTVLVYNSDKGFFEALRVSLFMMISCVTTTGFQNVESISVLPYGVIGIMIVLMLIGGCLGSTAGGIKQYRIWVVLKGLWYSIVGSMSNKRVMRTHYIYRAGKKEVLDNSEISETMTFVLMYLVIFFVGSIIISCFGYSFSDSMFEFASSISTVGLSVGVSGASSHPVVHIVCVFGMLLGRLEIYVVLRSIVRGWYRVVGKAVM